MQARTASVEWPTIGRPGYTARHGSQGVGNARNGYGDGVTGMEAT